LRFGLLDAAVARRRHCAEYGQSGNIIARDLRRLSLPSARRELLEEENMRSIFVAVLLSTFAIGSALAQQTCDSKAVGKDGKPLSGAAKTSFMQKCKKDACEPKAVGSNGKKLSGAAYKSFMDKCESGA
jgi:hypothetical protein